MDWISSTPSITQIVRMDSALVTSAPYYRDESLPPTTSVPIKQYWDIISLQWVRILIMAVTTLGVVIALIGNLLVLLVIYRRRSLRRNPTILFILNLALCDIVSCLVYRPLVLVEVFLPFLPHFQEIVNHLDKCKVGSYFRGLFAAVGFHTMVAISQERLLLIVYPLKAKLLCTVSRTLKILMGIWMSSALLVLPIPLKYTEIITLEIDGTIINFCAYFSGASLAIVYHAVMFAFYFGIPLLMLTVSYCKIFNALYRRNNCLDVNQDSGGGKSMRIRRNLAKMMLSVSIIFAICWGPHFIFFLYIACGGKVPKNGFFTVTIIEFLPIISSIMNPMLYTLNSRTFRIGFKNIIFRRRGVTDDPSGARSFANAESTHVNPQTRSHSLFAFSSFRLGGAKAGKSIKFVSGRRKFPQSRENGGSPSMSTGETSLELQIALPTLSTNGNSRRNAFNNNNFDMSQGRLNKENESEHEFSSSSRESRQCSSQEIPSQGKDKEISL